MTRISHYKNRYRKSRNNDADLASVILVLLILGLGGAVIKYKEQLLFYGPIFLGSFLLLAIFIVIFIKRRKNQQRIEYENDDQLLYSLRNVMDPENFEKEITSMFTRLGYKAEHTGKSHDGGIDVKLIKNGELYLVQCKKFIKQTAGVKDVRELLGVVTSHLAKKGIFISTNGFTPDAIQEFANNPRIELVDQFKLLKYYKVSIKK